MGKDKKKETVSTITITFKTIDGEYIASKGKNDIYLTKDASDEGTKWFQWSDGGYYRFINKKGKMFCIDKEGQLYLGKEKSDESNFTFHESPIGGRWALYLIAHQLYLKVQGGQCSSTKVNDQTCAFEMGNLGPSTAEVAVYQD